MEARALHLTDDPDLVEGNHPEPLGLAPDPVEIRRNGGLAALVGVVASAVAIAYLARATGTGAWLDWLLTAVMGLVGVAHLRGLVDARTPLLVADTQGVRIRLGRTWRGIPWGALERVEHHPRRGPLRDGRLVLVPRNTERALDELDRGGRRQSRIAEKLYGAPFALPLALSTRVNGAGGDLTAALARLADEPDLVLEVAPVVAPAQEAPGPERLEHGQSDPGETGHPAETPASVEEPVTSSWDVPDTSRSERPSDPAFRADPDLESDLDPDPGQAAGPGAEDDVDEHDEERMPSWPDPRPALARGIGSLAARLPRRRARDTAAEDLEPVADAHDLRQETAPQPVPEMVAPGLVASATPSPLREPFRAVRAELRSDLRLSGEALARHRAGDQDEAAAELPAARELRRPGSVSLVEDTVVWSDRVRPIAREGAAVEPLVLDDLGVEPAEDPVIGPELAAARTRLGLTVDQLAERTRIRPHVIESIEVDDFAPCGGDFYARGHLRTLARVLGTDVAPLLTSYDDRYADAPINPRRVFEAELATGTGGIRGTRGGPNWSVLIAAVMTLVLAWSVARLVMDSPVALTPPAPRLNGSAGPNNSAASLGDPVPVVLTATKGGAHVVVRDGTGDVAFTGDLSYGESHRIRSIVPPVRVQSSDGSLAVRFSGHDRGAIGKPGQPAQESYTAR